MSRNEVYQLFEGYSIVKDEKFMKANCSVTLVKGSSKIILVNISTFYLNLKIMNTKFSI